MPGDQTHMRPRAHVLKYVNASPLPVYQVEVTVQFDGTTTGYRGIKPALAPTSEPMVFDPVPGAFHRAVTAAADFEKHVPRQ